MSSNEPLVLASVGTWSGPVGAATKPAVEMLQVWARDVNDRGGVDGRSVRILVGDDGGDAARHVALVRQFVETNGAFAFLADAFPTTYSEAMSAYFKDHSVPLVGLGGVHPSDSRNPMFFPQQTTFNDWARSHVAGARAQRSDAKRWGQLVCREADACKHVDTGWASLASEYGFSPVYRAEASITQPDYTAECLAARNAGVEIMAVLLDPNAIRRLVQSCARQNFKPVLVLPASAASSSMAPDPNLNGTVAITTTAPWVATQNAGVAAMIKAVQRYSPGMRLDVASTQGWSAGKEFEAAVAKAGGLGSPPSRIRLVAGLHQFTNETLEGLSPPLTFRPGQPPSNPCWFAMVLNDGQWTAANNGQHFCP